ncbi:hypothetical protein AMATHDRAFT_5972 [Amanita thiersii Skay4041]|uniref:Uncharacterized protein n=1 Tax=Amanita thiersii Skay4041 TaxID=703135 RepID=A0A2A9NDX6_9AGAR|nr:hypothetical protein AMATHDRAFT_5972 [Amanita thiersii Skay4041]
MDQPSATQPIMNGNSVEVVNVYALGRATRKTLDRLAPFCHLKASEGTQDPEILALVDRIVEKVKAYISGIDLSMLATQMAFRLADEALKLSEGKIPEHEWKLVPRRADNGLSRLASLAEQGDGYAQKMMSPFTDVRQDLYKIAARTKEKADVKVCLPFDPAKSDKTLTKSLKDVGLDLVANLKVICDFTDHASSLANWWASVYREFDAAAAAAAITMDPNVQPSSPSSPGAMSLPPPLDADVWVGVKAEYQTYYRTIRDVQQRYPNLVPTSKEAWSLSAHMITYSQSDAGSEFSSAPSHGFARQGTSASQDTPHTPPTSPTEYFDARSRPMSFAVDNSTPLSKKLFEGDDKDKKQSKRKGMFRALTISHRRTASAPPDLPPSGSSPEKKTNMKKMKQFLFTRTVPRPETKGLFPSSLRMSLSRSKSTSKMEKGKEKEKEREADVVSPRVAFEKMPAAGVGFMSEKEGEEELNEKRAEVGALATGMASATHVVNATLGKEDAAAAANALTVMVASDANATDDNSADQHADKENQPPFPDPVPLARTPSRAPSVARSHLSTKSKPRSLKLKTDHLGNGLDHSGPLGSQPNDKQVGLTSGVEDADAGKPSYGIARHLLCGACLSYSF